MIMLDKKSVKHLYNKLVEATGGLYGIRDEAALESSLSAAFQTFDGADLYPTTVSKIARVTYCLVKSHPFVDGNKRIGTYVLLVLLELNGININFSNEDVIHIGLGLASGEMDYQQLLEFILSKTRIN